MPDEANRLELNPTQRRLYEALVIKRADVGEYYRAAVVVLNDPALPDRMSLAAHALRELMEKLPNDEMTVDMGADLATKVRELRIAWEPAIKEDEEHGGEAWTSGINETLRTFLRTVKMFFEGQDKIAGGRKEQAARFLDRLDVSPLALPKDVQLRNAKEWMKLRKYFNDVAHHRFADDDKAFLKQVTQLEAFLSARLVPRPTVDFAAIDALLEEG